jgi:hypothetical protein
LLLHNGTANVHELLEHLNSALCKNSRTSS